MKKFNINPTKILLLLAVIAVIFIPGRFGWDNLNLLQVEAEQIQSEADNLNAQASKVETETSDRTSFDARRTRASTAITPTPDVASMIDTLSEHATISGLIWTTGSPSVASAPSGVGAATSLSVEVRPANPEVTGNDAATLIGNYLNEIRNLDRLSVVEDLSLSPSAGSATFKVIFFSETDGE